MAFRPISEAAHSWSYDNKQMVAALLRAVRVTAGLAESNGSLLPDVTCRLSAKNRDQLWNPMLGSRVLATFTIFEQMALNRFTHGCQSVESYPVLVGFQMQRTSCQLLLWKVGFGKLKSNGVSSCKRVTHFSS